MAEPGDSAARIDAIEERVAYQERAIELLNQAVTAQWQEIDRLKRQLAALSERLHDAESKASAGAPRDPPPPHY